MGCTSSRPTPNAEASPATRFSTTSGAATTTHRPNAPLRVPRSCPVGPTIPRTRTALDRERQAFFETRVTGRPEVWQAVQLALSLVRDEGDLNEAQGVLDAMAITVPSGRLEEGVWDEMGQLYMLEHWVVADPVGLVEDGEVKEDFVADTAASTKEDRTRGGGAAVAVVPTLAEQSMKIRCRMSDRGTDLVVPLGRSQSVATLGALLRKQANLAPTARLKFAYLGKILRDHQALGEQGWVEGHIVSALVSLPP